MLIIWLVVICIALILISYGFFLWQHIQQLEKRVKKIEINLKIFHNDLAVISSCQVEAVEHDHVYERKFDQYIRITDQRLEALEQRLRQLTRRQDEQISTNDPNEISYGAAIRLAHKGADVEQLVNAFGLARGEAELIAALHRAQSQESREPSGSRG